MPTTVLWLTDSTNLTCFLEKGSTKISIQKDVLKVFELALRHNLVLLPVHLLREDPRIVLADQGSKWNDTDDWTVDWSTAENAQIWAGVQCNIDLFADPNNSKCARFCARYNCPRVEAVDAFSISWAEEVAWICPPTTRLVDTIRKIAHSPGLRGVLVVPAWRTALFWAVLFPDGKHATECFSAAVSCRPFLLQGTSNGTNNLMKGYTAFPFLLLAICSSGSGSMKAGRATVPVDV